jgi:predicted DNA-binding protein
MTFVGRNLPRRWLIMSEPTITPGAGASTGGQLRTLAVRITEDLRAQLDIIAQLTGRSTTEEIRLALEHWIERTKSDPELLQKAEAVRAEIEREAQTRRNAIAAIFNEGSGDAGGPSARSTRRSTRPSE